MKQKKKWKGRAHDATADMMFERALLGDSLSDRKSFNPREDRKTQQLCQQVRRALMLALAGECDDDVLREVYVDSVEPMGSGSQLLVRVTVPPMVRLHSLDVLARLNDRSARLRALVAQSICRKRVPSLSFIAVPQSAHGAEGGRP
ncbi:MAG: ribosome-binding factor A [Planctomycetota bacterium]|nr:ribosome-binding factor A [Planctomycetota bacterium]